MVKIGKYEGIVVSPEVNGENPIKEKPSNVDENFKDKEKEQEFSK